MEDGSLPKTCRDDGGAEVSMRGVGWAQNLRSSEDGKLGGVLYFSKLFPRFCSWIKALTHQSPTPCVGRALA